MTSPFIVTYLLMGVTILVSYIGFQQPALFERLKHSPYAETRTGQYERLLTSGFLHGSWLHLGINMFVFYSFGRNVEACLTGYVREIAPYSFSEWAGHLVFLLLYLATIVLANLYTLKTRADDPGYGAIGASGAVSGVVFCSVLFFPWDNIYLYGIIAIPAILAGVAFLAYSQYAAKRASDNIDHSAHFYGALAMPLLLLLLRPSLFGHFVTAFRNGLPF